MCELYFKNQMAWREWLEANHDTANGVHLIFYKVAHENESMRWEEAVQVALCFGWIDSTVRSLGDGKRKQYFCPRKPKSVWSKLNKSYIKVLIAEGKMHPSGLEKIRQAREDGSWHQLDDVENGVIPEDLQQAFRDHPQAERNYHGFSWTYRKSYLYWLHHAKRSATRQVRIETIVRLCLENKKSRS